MKVNKRGNGISYVFEMNSKRGNGISYVFDMKSKRGQIWVETVIYTLIAFVLIGAVLAIAQPRIEEIQDKAFIEQSLGVMKDVDNILLSLAQGGVGNKRVIELGVKNGNFIIDGENDRIIFEIDSVYAYSEPGQDYKEGNMIINTMQKGDVYSVNITRTYISYNITYGGAETSRIIGKASAPYRVSISHNGKDASNKIKIDFEVQ
ncbi:MAG: hypothetical protein WD876_00410 [Candidatus Pacearchaeota archaeon]